MPRSSKKSSKIVAKKVVRKRRSKVKQTTLQLLKRTIQKKIRSLNRKWLGSKKKRAQARRLSIVGLILGINLIVISGIYLAYRRTILSFQVTPVVQAEARLRHSQPVQIKVNGTPIDLPITPAYIVNGIWETSDSTATHLTTSARPGEGGNVVIYGHNRNSLLRSLHGVQVGDTIEVTSEDGTIYEYKIENTEIIKPSQIEVVSPTDHEVLTMYTCTGFLDSKRLVVRATPSRVSSSL